MLVPTIALLCLTAAAPDPPEAFVREHHGVPTLFINGQPHPGTSYMTYRPEAKNFREMGRIGVHLYSFSATPTESTYNLAPSTWIGPNEFDYRGFDARVKMLLDADPEAFFFPRLYLGTPPWWADAHPDDLVRYDPGDGTSKELRVSGKRVASWSSKAWRQGTADALKRFTGHVETSDYADHVIGYHIASGTTEEWMQWGSNQDHWGDYSAVNVAAYRQWLTEKYETDENLRRAWSNDSASLATARVASRKQREAVERGFLRDPAVAQASIDYARYTSWLVTDTIRHFARITKDAVDGKRLVGVFYGYVLQLAGAPREQVSGHHALHEILECPHIDFITSPTSYSGRNMATGFPHAMSLVDSIKLHGKLWFDENDFRTFLAQGVPPQFPGYTDTFEKTVLSQRRSFAWTFTNRLGMWWFDMGGGWYDDPRMLSELEQMNRIAFENLEVDGRSVAQIAFVVDDHSSAYLSTSNPFSFPALILQLQELGHVGAPFDVVHISDLDRSPDYRLYVFPNLIAPREADRQRVAQKLARGGSVLWIGPAGLYREGCMVPEAMEELTGFSLHLVDSPARWKIVPTNAAEPWGWSDPEPYECGGKPGLTPSARDSDGKVLGRSAGTDLPALVARAQKGGVAVYSSIPKLPAALLRAIAEKAGVHCYSRTGDIVWASQQLLAVSAKEPGKRTILLPGPQRVLNLFSGELLEEQANRVEVDLGKHETLLLRLD